MSRLQFDLGQRLRGSLPLAFKMDEATQEKMQVLDLMHVDDAVPMQMDDASELYLTQKRGGRAIA